MNSIRRRLLLAILIATTAGTALIGALVYWHARDELDELYNAHLQQLALTLQQQLLAVQWRPQQSPPLPVRRGGNLDEEEDYLIQLWTRGGELHYSSLPQVALPLQTRSGFEKRRFQDRAWRSYRADNPEFSVQVAQPERARRGIMRETAGKILLPLALQIPLLAVLGWLAVRRGLRPLDTLSAAIAQRRPAALAPLPAGELPRELQPLVQALNELLQRLQTALQQQRDFIADAAHELRTPLGALQLQLDLLQRAHTPAEREQSLAALAAGIRRSTHLVQQLLLAVRSEQPAPAQDDAALERVAAAVVEELLPLARHRGIDLGCTRVEAARARAAAADVHTLLTNLVDNAIRYTPAQGRVDVAVYAEGESAVLEVSDSGAGIPAGERVRVFDRFYRVPGTAAEGSGLGLAIVRAIAERNAAQLDLGDNPTGTGTRVTVRFPRA